MKNYRTFEVTENDDYKLKGKITFRLDDEDKLIFKRLREIGFNITRRTNKLVWWSDEYAEIINKRTERTVGFLELMYV